MEFEKCKAKRGVIRRLTTKLLRRIEVDLKVDNSVEGKLGNLQDLKSQLEEKEIELKNLDSEIETGTSVEKLEEEITQSQEYREKVILWKGRLQRFISQNRRNFDEVVPGNETASNRSILENERKMNAIKMPRFQMSTFNGDSSKWIGFRNQFECTIHNNEDLGKIEKFTYLKSLLNGNALAAISGFVLSDRNYDSSIEILKDRFGRQDIVISSHMNKLLSIEPVRYISNVKALRKLFDECEIQIRSLKSLNVTSGSYGNLLCPIILQKVPDELNFEFNRNRKDPSKFDITELIEFLRKEINCREAANLMNCSKNIERRDSRRSGNQWFNNDFKPKLASASTLSTISNKCLFCGRNDHGKFKCEELDSPKKRDFLIRTRRCFICFGQRHLSIICTNKHLSCKKCRGKPHHESICSKPRNAFDISHGKEEEESVEIAQTSSTILDSEVVLQTVFARADGKGKNCIIRCLLDGGSQVSFIREDVSKQLGLPCKRYSDMNVYTFGELIGKQYQQRRIVELTLRNIEQPERFITLDVVETPVITSAEIKMPDGKIKSLLSELGVTLKNHSANGVQPISVLIGSDYLWEITNEKFIRINENAVAMDTVLGYMITGKFASTKKEVKSVYSNLLVEENLCETLEIFWRVESLGVNHSDERLEEKKALTLFESSIKKENKRYEVKLPWINDNVTLSDNYVNAERRFLNLMKQFRANANFYEDYKEVINDQIKSGIIERVSSDEARGERVYYIPHRAVIRKNHRSTKLRVVFDASSKEKNEVSLNDCLLQGPNFLPELLKVLLKFRLHRIAFTADIQKAFLQISVACEDRDAMRFLWIQEGSSLSHPKIQIYRMCRVMFGAKSSPFLLNACIKHHLKKFEEMYPESVKLLETSMYMDDLICGTDTEREARKIFRNANEIMKDASMTLTKWNSNSAVLRKEYGTKTHCAKLEQPCYDSSFKVLGLEWDTSQDIFTFSGKDIVDFISESEPTKRCILKAVSRIFDPLGFLSPYVIQAKVFFQNMWVSGIDWDKPIPIELQSKWIKWHEQLYDLPKIKIPRWYFNKDGSTSSD